MKFPKHTPGSNRWMDQVDGAGQGWGWRAWMLSPGICLGWSAENPAPEDSFKQKVKHRETRGQQNSRDGGNNCPYSIPLLQRACLAIGCCCCCCVTSFVSDSVRPHRWQPTRLPRPWDSQGKNTGVGCHFLLQRMKVKSESEVAQSCPTLRPHGLQPTRLLHPWDFPGKSTGLGCHCLLQK